MCAKKGVGTNEKASETSVKAVSLKDVGIEVPKSIERRTHPCSKAGYDGMQQ